MQYDMAIKIVVRSNNPEGKTDSIRLANGASKKFSKYIIKNIEVNLEI